MSETPLPPCGIYRTRAAIGEVPAGRLVYFHNHGDPGPGIYLPSRWRGNRARFERKGYALEDLSEVDKLEPLPAEGFYRVVEAFYCCDRHCRRFEPDALVQLGYDGTGRAIIFMPEVVDGLLGVPEHGTRVDVERLAHLARLRVAVSTAPADDDNNDVALLH